MALKDTLRAHQFRFKKKFGQNFITDPGLLSRITEEAALTKEDTVLEIGAGAGTLTETLARAAGQVIALEIDPQLEPVLRHRLADYTNIDLILGDALKLDFDTLVAERGGSTYKIVANLPYYITTPLIMRILEESARCTEAIIMVQKEVAERLLSPPGRKTYGAITVMVRYYAQVTQLFGISRASFTPVPEVDSAVLRLRPYTKPPMPAENVALLRHVVRAAFGQRRKTLRNALASGGFTPDAVQSALTTCDIDPATRGETLSPEAFVGLSNALYHQECFHDNDKE